MVEESIRLTDQRGEQTPEEVGVRQERWRESCRLAMIAEEERRATLLKTGMLCLGCQSSWCTCGLPFFLSGHSVQRELF